MSIALFLRDGGVFDPSDIKAMSMALNDVCKTLKLANEDPRQEVIAERIIALTRDGERSPTRLRDKVLQESGLAQREGANDDGAKRPPP